MLVLAAVVEVEVAVAVDGTDTVETIDMLVLELDIELLLVVIELTLGTLVEAVVLLPPPDSDVSPVTYDGAGVARDGLTRYPVPHGTAVLLSG